MDNVLILFSGGRDSSLATCLLAQNGKLLTLFSAFNGAVVKSEVIAYRVNELKEVFGDAILKHEVVSTVSLFRRIALAEIEQDFAKYKYNLIPVGDALATHAMAIVYCKRNRINLVASGYVRYENEFPEQYPEIIALTKAFMKEYEIEYITPVFDYDSRDKLKYRLLDFGISTKSFEGISIFADTYSVPPVQVVEEYVIEKLSICREFIRFMLNTD